MNHYQMKRGEKVMVMNLTPEGVVIEEGIAELLKPLGKVVGEQEYWLVRFNGEGTSERYPRWVNPVNRKN